jgi:hypothetical protein
MRVDVYSGPLLKAGDPGDDRLNSDIEVIARRQLKYHAVVGGVIQDGSQGP